MDLKINITGSEAIMEKVRRLGASLYELGPEFEEIGQTLAEFYANEAFNSRGGVYGQEWEPLSPGYAAWKGQHFPGRPMEVQTGTMQNSFGWAATPMSVKVRNSAKTKNGLPLLALQQLGTKRGLPPRVIMALEETLKEKIKLIVHGGIKRKIEEA